MLRLPVLGVETSFVADSPRVQNLLLDAYGAWLALQAMEGLVRPSPGEVHIRVRDFERVRSAEGSISIGVASSRVMEVVGPGVRGATDARQLRAEVEIDRTWLEDPSRLVREVIEPLVLYLVGAQDRVPLHAAGVIRDDVGIVLAAPSGTGKSTLVMAASRGRFAPLADDPVYVQIEPSLRVWGRRSTVHLRPDAVEHFPDLANAVPQRQPTGKMKLVVDPGGSRRHVERVGLCVLRRRGAGSTRLRRISPDEALEEITAEIDPGFDLYSDVLGDRVLRLAALGAWRMELGDSPFDALPLLDEIVDAIEADD